MTRSEYKNPRPLNKLSQAWDQASDRILNTVITNINVVNKKRLSDFTTQELEQEILNRKQCQFNRLSCTQKAESWIIKPQKPACFNCQQDILSLKDHD